MSLLGRTAGSWGGGGSGNLLLLLDVCGSFHSVTHQVNHTCGCYILGGREGGVKREGGKEGRRERERGEERGRGRWKEREEGSLWLP